LLERFKNKCTHSKVKYVAKSMYPKGERRELQR